MRSLGCLVLLLLPCLIGVRARAEDPPPEASPLTVRRLFDGRPFTTPLPDWSWRPGHSERLLETRRPSAGGGPEQQVLLAARNDGSERELLDFGALHEQVGEGGASARGIGRAGAPRMIWAKDGRALCAVLRGSLVWVALHEPAPARVLFKAPGALSDIQIAPDSSHVSFVMDHDLWMVPVAGGDAVRLTHGGSEETRNASLDWVYPEELGHTTGYWWAPSSERIAFLQLDEREVPFYRVPGLIPLRSEGRTMRYPKVGDPNPKARVGVVPVGGADPVWLNLGEPAPEYVVRVTWLPGDRAVLVLTLDRPQRTLRLFACDPATGEGRVVLTQTDPAWIVPPPAPRVHAGKWVLLRSEPDSRSWFAHLLLDTPAGPALGPPVRLTPPGIDADDLLHLVMGESGPTEVIFDGSAHGSGRSLVWRTTDGVAQPLFDAGARGSVDASLDSTAAYALVRRSSQETPTTLELWDVAEQKQLQLLGDSQSPELQSLDLAVAEVGEIAIPGCPHGCIRYRLWRPRTLDPARRYGLLVHVYGGPDSRMVRDAWGRGPLLETLFVDRGVLVLEVDGRGSAGFGAAFTRLVQGRLGLLELEDQVRAVQELSKRPYIDPRRVGIWGWSYGGFMACLALTKRSDVFRAGVAVASVTDWRLYDSIYTERYMGLIGDNKAGYDETSCVGAAAGLKGHLLILHGMGDDNVHAQNAFRLIDAFIASRVTSYESMFYPGRGHGIEGAGYDVFSRLVAHVERHLAR